MPVATHQRLVGRLLELDRSLLPQKDRQRGNYTQEEYDRMLGYRVLAHAELEGFLERIAELGKASVLSACRANKSIAVSPTLGRIVGYIDAREYPPYSLTASKPAPLTRVQSLMGDLGNFITGNNGVSEKDVLKLLLPLGADPNSFDTGWLAELNRFSDDRGDVAHQGWANATIIQRHPSVEREQVRSIALGMLRIAYAVQSLLAGL